MTLNSGLLTLVHLLKLSIGLWQLTHTSAIYNRQHIVIHHMYKVSEIMCFCARKGGREDYRASTHYIVCLDIYSKVISMYEHVYMFPGSREAKQRLTSSR